MKSLKLKKSTNCLVILRAMLSVKDPLDLEQLLQS